MAERVPCHPGAQVRQGGVHGQDRLTLQPALASCNAACQTLETNIGQWIQIFGIKE